MHPRTEAAIGLAVLATVCAIVAATTRGQAVTASGGPPTTFATGPAGASGMLEALRALGMPVRRFRERPSELATLVRGDPDRLLVVLQPWPPIGAADLAPFVAFSDSADLLLAGTGAEELMRCFGYTVKSRIADSVVVPSLGPRFRLGAVLEATHQAEFVDSSRVFDVALGRCRVPAFSAVTTVLASPDGAELVSLTRRDNGHRVMLAADAALFTNQRLRYTAAGPLVLGLIDRSYHEVIFDEYHHGFGDSGSLTAATLAWSRRSPWGWAAWQLATVAVLALLFGAVRFGPVTPAIARQRRSPLEHVSALANALAAAHGHDEAIGALIRGLRRRLTPRRLRSAGDWRPWLLRLDQRTTAPPARAPIDDLMRLTRPGQPAASVLRAADDVEDIWQSLHT